MSGGRLNRTPPVAVQRELAEEVGWGCPVEGCGSPYLTWHHFDPPYAEKEHHDPAGMIALCRDHHPEADAGAFTVEQLRELKRVGRDRSKLLGARFNWMYDELLAVVGGNYFLRTPIVLQIGERPIVWFNRTDSGRLLVNLDTPSQLGEMRMQMRDNFWIAEGVAEHEIRCPPMGRLVQVKYPDGDELKVEFHRMKSLADFDRRFPPIDIAANLPAEQKAALEAYGGGIGATSHLKNLERFGVEFPLAVVEVTLKIAGGDLHLGPTETSIGTNTFAGNWSVDCGVGFQIDVP